MKRTETKLLGLELCAVGLEPGQTRTFKEMESWCDAVAEVTGDKSQAMSWQRFHQIEQRALRKLRIRIMQLFDTEISEEIRDEAMAVIFPRERQLANRIAPRCGNLARFR